MGCEAQPLEVGLVGCRSFIKIIWVAQANVLF